MKRNYRMMMLCGMLAFSGGMATAQSALDGDWRLIASPMGVETAGGIMTTGWDTIPFRATLSADGRYLQCHTDRFLSRNGHDYPADWLMAVEHNDGDGRTRLGWVCDEAQPASATEFQEPASAYAIGGRDAVEGEHRYLYFLSYNIATGREEGMTLWSGWGDGEQAVYAFPQNQQIDGIVSTTIPFATFVGYADSWASARVERTAAMSDVQGAMYNEQCTMNRVHDLQGRQLKNSKWSNRQMPKGLYIVDGKKVVR